MYRTWKTIIFSPKDDLNPNTNLFNSLFSQILDFLVSQIPISEHLT